MITKRDGRYWKNCPECGEEVSYLRANYARESERLGKVCKKCANRKPSNSGHKGWENGIRVSWFNKIKTGAETRGLEFNLTTKDLSDIWTGKCALTGWDLKDLGRVNNEASLDRIDSSKGYIVGNIQFLHKDVNFMKQAFDNDYFISAAKAITENIAGHEI